MGYYPPTADFMKKVPVVCTPSMKTIYLSLSAQVAEGTIFRKSPVCRYSKYRQYIYSVDKYIDRKTDNRHA